MALLLKKTGLFVILAITLIPLNSCSKLLGWGVLLWASEEPAIPSGTVLPVYIKSNLNKTWVAGIPEQYRGAESDIDKFEIPLPLLELVGSRAAAEKRADEFAGMARIYAETLQDGLPIRQSPDNVARRVYRLKMGEIVKPLAKVEGQAPISATGESLDGEWYQVMTEDGTTGYCFSLRLRLFEHTGGPLSVARNENDEEDPDLDRLLLRTWSPESYSIMVNSKRIDVEELAKHWEFMPGIDTGIAHIYLPHVDKRFSYTGIRAEGARTWRFEGSRLRISLRSDTTLAVQYYDEGGALKTELFVALASDVDDLIMQELARRDELFYNLYNTGPIFSSTNYGRLSFSEDGRFMWSGYRLLVPQVISALALGTGTIDMGIFLGSAVSSLYDGAFAFNFEETGDRTRAVYFMYTLESQGMRIEYVPPSSMDGLVVARRASSPTVIYFFKTVTLEQPSIDLPPSDMPYEQTPPADTSLFYELPSIDVPSLDLPAPEQRFDEPWLDELPLDEPRFNEPWLDEPVPFDFNPRALTPEDTLSNDFLFDF
ncbi:MAG: SH3 domain-containing protein [Treponema sp.]|jgi:hypothetical protein|nr:SH3 domain-containing protein [Treponema sp.]